MVDRSHIPAAVSAAARSDVDLQITQFDVRDNEVEAAWRFSAILDLPWKPRLAAAGVKQDARL